MYIQTLRGLQPAVDIAIADAHAHLWIGPGVSKAPLLTNEQLAQAELADFADAGGQLVVDCQPGGCGRDGRILMRLAQTAPVAIVAATGFHLARYYAPMSGVWGLSDNAACSYFIRELRCGLDEAPQVQAGVIKCAWAGNGGREINLMQAALEAARSTGAALIVHTEAGSAVEELMRLIEASGVSPTQVQLSHIDKRPEWSLHRDLARAGYVLGYDTFLRPKYQPEKHVWPLLQHMLSEGLWPQITLGLDLVETSQWHVAGGPGLRTISIALLPRLRASGASTQMIRALGGGNIARLLGRYS